MEDNCIDFNARNRNFVHSLCTWWNLACCCSEEVNLQNHQFHYEQLQFLVVGGDVEPTLLNNIINYSRSDSPKFDDMHISADAMPSTAIHHSYLHLRCMLTLSHIIKQVFVTIACFRYLRLIFAFFFLFRPLPLNQHPPGSSNSVYKKKDYLHLNLK